MRVTTDDLLDALRGALTRPPSGEAPTVPELCDTLGVGERAMRQALRAFAAQGRLEVVRVRRPDLTGRVQQVPGYRLRKAKRAA